MFFMQMERIEKRYDSLNSLRKHSRGWERGKAPSVTFENTLQRSAQPYGNRHVPITDLVLFVLQDRQGGRVV